MNYQNNICNAPFSEIEIHENGNIYFCCPSKIGISIGNIYKEDFDKIWYSDIANEIRSRILENKDYKYCNLAICNPINNINQDKLLMMDSININYEKPDYPLFVKFCHDRHCNIKCITCRDEYCTNSQEQNDFLNNNIEKIYLPILKNCKIVSLNGSGEVFASKHGKTLIKAIVNKYPDIKFDIHTNGVLCTKELCDELGITEKLISIDISMHAYSKEIYEKIMQGSNFEKVRKNLEWLKELKAKGQLKNLDIYFVVQKMNYKEMPKMIEYAASLGANIHFWEFRNWGNKWAEQNYDKVAIYEKWHPEYNKFAKFMQQDIFKSQNCHLNNFLANIKPISPIKHLKSIYRKYRKK